MPSPRLLLLALPLLAGCGPMPGGVCDATIDSFVCTNNQTILWCVLDEWEKVEQLNDCMVCTCREDLSVDCEDVCD